MDSVLRFQKSIELHLQPLRFWKHGHEGVLQIEDVHELDQEVLVRSFGFLQCVPNKKKNQKGNEEITKSNH